MTAADSGDSTPAQDASGTPVSVHTSVMLAESLQALNPQPGEIAVDGTLGAAGHSAAFARRLGATGLLIGLDQDAEILVHAEARLAREAASADVDPPAGAPPPAAADSTDASTSGWPRVVLRHASYLSILDVLAELGVEACDLVFLDLGVSSLQLDSAQRGFSFMRDGPLDMRMNRQAERPTAAAWLRNVHPDELTRVLVDFGGERHARRITAALVEARRRAPIERTGQLADLVVRALPPKARHGRIHAATRTFQAIRIAVNDELGALQRGLVRSWRALRPGGRLGVLTFHSAEDRLVKQFLRQHCDLPFRKPLEATATECSANPRARSARLRVGLRPLAADAGSGDSPRRDEAEGGR